MFTGKCKLNLQNSLTVSVDTLLLFTGKYELNLNEGVHKKKVIKCLFTGKHKLVLKILQLLTKKLSLFYCCLQVSVIYQGRLDFEPIFKSACLQVNIRYI